MIAGTITLELEGTERMLMVQGEARIAPGVPHRRWNAAGGDARVVEEFRRVA